MSRVRFLGFALYAEGPTDHRFHGRLLGRLAEDICIGARQPVGIGPVQSIEAAPPLRSLPARILEAAQAAEGSFDVLFIHQDGGKDAARARSERIAPAAALLATEMTEKPWLVHVVPVRETEAWAIADGDALRAAFGSTLSDTELGIPPRARDVEKVADPKQSLEHAWQAAAGPRRSRRRRASSFLEAIGERVSLERLRQVPAFQEMEGELRSALQTALNP